MQETKGCREEEAEEDEQRAGGNFATVRNFIGCEISQVAKIHKPVNFYTAPKTPALCYSFKIENTKNYKNTYMKERKITKKDKLKLGKLRKTTNKT